MEGTHRCRNWTIANLRDVVAVRLSCNQRRLGNVVSTIEGNERNRVDIHHHWVVPIHHHGICVSDRIGISVDHVHVVRHDVGLLVFRIVGPKVNLQGRSSVHTVDNDIHR